MNTFYSETHIGSVIVSLGIGVVIAGFIVLFLAIYLRRAHAETLRLTGTPNPNEPRMDRIVRLVGVYRGIGTIIGGAILILIGYFGLN